MHYVSGLDLGALQDYTALVTLECEGRAMGVRRAHRWPLGTAYPVIVEDIHGIFGKAPLVGSQLVVDRTGVGVAVVDFIQAAGIPAVVEAWTITAGREPNSDRNTVPKADLVAAIHVGIGTGTLTVANGLKHWPTLNAELKAFRSKVNPTTRNEAFSAREGEWDDLVLALALSAWKAMQWYDPELLHEINARNARKSPFERLPPGTFRDGSVPGWPNW
jgi:hypothetical protein